jgi:hypothetical protein
MQVENEQRRARKSECDEGESDSEQAGQKEKEERVSERAREQK